MTPTAYEIAIVGVDTLPRRMMACLSPGQGHPPCCAWRSIGCCGSAGRHTRRRTGFKLIALAVPAPTKRHGQPAVKLGARAKCAVTSLGRSRRERRPVGQQDQPNGGHVLFTQRRNGPSRFRLSALGLLSSSLPFGRAIISYAIQIANSSIKWVVCWFQGNRAVASAPLHPLQTTRMSWPSIATHIGRGRALGSSVRRQFCELRRSLS